MAAACTAVNGALGRDQVAARARPPAQPEAGGRRERHRRERKGQGVGQGQVPRLAHDRMAPPCGERGYDV